MKPTLAFAVSALLFATSFADAEKGTVNAVWHSEKITCEIGDKLAGYGGNDVSVEIHDDLYACCLALDDGKNKVALVSLDLLGMDIAFIRRIRGIFAAELGIPADSVMVSCTHTHEGPNTRLSGPWTPDNDTVNERYMAFLYARMEAAAKAMKAKGWTECRVGYYSASVDENRNRRFTTADNHASFNAHRRRLNELTTGIADKEFGTLMLVPPDSTIPLYVIGNYAAHPLAAHSPGLGGLRISADYPGVWRNYVKNETGAGSMFISGAAGDLIPKEDELGWDACEQMGRRLGKSTMESIIDIQRNTNRFIIKKPRVGALIHHFVTPLRKRWHGFFGDYMPDNKMDLELQVLSIGDVAFVGVPGEVVNELGLEIKWHSPYRRTFIAYLASGYFNYMSPANFVAAGGYEVQTQRFPSRDSLRMVKESVDALFNLRSGLFPEDETGDEPYPDNLTLPLVNLPDGVKAVKGHDPNIETTNK